MTRVPRRSAFAALRGRPDTEHEMSFNRLAFALVISVYLASQSAPPVAQLLSGLYWIVAIGLFAHILYSPASNVPRRILALCLDMGFLSAELHVGGEVTSAFAPIYLWVVLGNGFRFGVAWLRGAMAIAIVGFIGVWLTTPFWYTQPHLSGGFLAGLVAIPAYAGTLIRKLNAAKQQAEQASQAKSMFLASVSHELRTPLNAIIGMGGLLERSPLDAGQREMARTVSDAGRSLLGLIDGILDFSRIEAGRMPIRPEPVSIPALLAETRRMLARHAQEKGLRLLFHVTRRTPPSVLADPRMLRELLLNLAGNAVKFTSHGYVLVALDAAPAESEGGLLLRIEVTDTGIGIAKEAHRRIFESFSQADDTIINRFGGTGLGLAICQRIVDQLGGDIGVESSLGRGSTFRVLLPLRSSGAVPLPRGGEAVFLARNAPARISRFAGSGFSLRAATTLAEALELLAAVAPAAPRVLLAEPAPLGLAADAIQDALEQQDPANASPLVLLTDAPPEHLPDLPLRRAALTLLPAEPTGVELAAALGLAAAFATHTDLPELEPADAGRSLAVLVADDNKVNRRVVQRILESAGHRPTLVTNGEEALEALEDQHFDLVLMDVNMPVIDGIEAAKLYRFQASGRRRVPIVALTADAMPGTRQRCLEAGMAACLVKPVPPLTLLEAVRTHAVSDEPEVVAAPRARPLHHLPASHGEGTAIDDGALADLDALGGPEFVDSVVGEFLDDAEVLLADLASAAERTDSVAFRAKAHALRSAAANVGARGLCDMCRAAQDTKPAELAATGAQFVARLRTEFAYTRHALLARSGSASPARST